MYRHRGATLVGQELHAGQEEAIQVRGGEVLLSGMAAAQRPEVAAVVSRGGRPDLAGEYLPRVQAPTLLIVGGNDVPVIGMNQQALRQLGAADKQLVIVPGATHLFEEPGALEEVARLAREWFQRHLGA
jgi:putative phosphoribosyl transferase